MSVTINGTNGLTFNDNSTQTTAATGFGFKNRIINGAMVIDQRNAGASVTPTSGQYLVDRWVATLTQASKFTVQQNAGSVTLPTGFINYLGITSSSAYSVLTGDTFLVSQFIEGLNVSDLSWGSSSASAVTLSFWVRSSLTGTFGGAVSNSAANRSYPFSYTISSANTWEQQSVTIPGDTTGTWLTTNGIGMRIRFGLGSGATYSGAVNTWASSDLAQPTGTTSVVGTNGATFYITGVQLEKGSTATSFDYRPYGTELTLCQRYYYKNKSPGASTFMNAVGGMFSTTSGRVSTAFPVTMRAAPGALEQTGTAGDYAILQGSGGVTCTAVPTYQNASIDGALTNVTISGGTLASYAMLRGVNSNAFLAWSAEL